MKKNTLPTGHFRRFILFLFALSPLFLWGFLPKSNPNSTVIYIVRHAEKVTDDPSDKDPDLTKSGYQRARKLDTLLSNIPFDAVYSTPFKRTMETARPTAVRNKKAITPYPPNNPSVLANLIQQNHPGKSVLVVGHSNTLVSLVKAFGGKTELTEIPESNYEYIFVVRIAENGEVQTETTNYEAFTKREKSSGKRT